MRSSKDATAQGHRNCEMKHFIPLQGEDVSFLAWSSYLGLSFRSGFSYSCGTDPQDICGHVIHAGTTLCLCGVPRTDPVSVGTEHCLVSSFYKIKALISISISSIKFVCKYFPSSQTYYEWDCPLGGCHSAWLPLP